MSFTVCSVKNGALSISLPVSLLHCAIATRRLWRWDAISRVCWNESQIGGIPLGSMTPQYPLRAATLFSEYSLPPTSSAPSLPFPPPVSLQRQLPVPRLVPRRGSFAPCWR
jgi:hypothetical protein